MPAIVAQCGCGAKYKVDESVIGRRVRCKKCGEAFEIRGGSNDAISCSPSKPPAAPSSREAPTPIALDLTIPAALPAAAAVAVPVADLGYAPLAKGESPADRGPLGLLRALLNAFLFFRRLGNVRTFLFAWIVLAAGNIGSALLLAIGNYSFLVGGLGLLAFFLAEGSFAAFSFDIVRQAAEGEDELPDYPLTAGPEDWWGLLIKPFFVFVGASMLVLAPAIIYSMVISATISEDSTAGPISELVGSGGLVVLGLFLWPMVILCLTIGSSSTLLRVGRIIPAIVQTFGPYALTVLTVYLSAAAYMAIRICLDQGNLPGIILTVAAYGIRVFLQIAAMRAVGAYYHRHYQNLAWMLD
jgi:hypothetical protein